MSPRTRPLAAVSTAAAEAQRGHGGQAGARGRSETSLRALAETLVRNKVTTKAPELVAVLLADRAAGMRPTAIAAKHQVRHSVVRKVLHAARGRIRLCVHRGGSPRVRRHRRRRTRPSL
jgi:hypothetical protein